MPRDSTSTSLGRRVQSRTLWRTPNIIPLRPRDLVRRPILVSREPKTPAEHLIRALQEGRGADWDDNLRAADARNKITLKFFIKVVPGETDDFFA
ncbi:hypothetical protein BV20DRAFT_964616, partial [Pilatotrama ljubarskyi]